MLQKQGDTFMTEELTDSDDYVDWIRWVSDAEQSRQAAYGSTQGLLDPLQLQQPTPTINSSMPVLLQTIHMRNGDLDYKPAEKLTTTSPLQIEHRWKEIYQRIRIDIELDDGGQQQIWRMLEQYQDVFVWNKGELGCCTLGEHCIDTQGFPPCKASPGQLSY
jgi:hypothetical protein